MIDTGLMMKMKRRMKMSENLEVLIKSAEEIGNLRERAKILGFIRGQIILFEKKIMD